MQVTQLDSALSQTLDNAGKAGWRLVIGNKNYSSWSMRPWVAMRAFNIPFQEIPIGLGSAEAAEKIACYSPSGRVPVLLADDMAVWDSLAICEFAAEQFPEKN